jgi:hypothetical protein
MDVQAGRNAMNGNSDHLSFQLAIFPTVGFLSIWRPRKCTPETSTEANKKLPIPRFVTNPVRFPKTVCWNYLLQAAQARKSLLSGTRVHASFTARTNGKMYSNKKEK